MTHEELLRRILIDPNVCHGKPRIRGHRVWVSVVLGMLEGAVSHEAFLAEYPFLEEADILACLAYANELAAGRFVDVRRGEAA
jgi:uncharacterized protein (DUF433 family)